MSPTTSHSDTDKKAPMSAGVTLPDRDQIAAWIRAYYRAGWSITGLHGLVKTKPAPTPIKMTTGYGGRHLTEQGMLDALDHFDGKLGLAVHCKPWVVGIDVDAYGDKDGDRELSYLEDEVPFESELGLGILPPTYVSTARPGTAAGIRWFRVEGTEDELLKLAWKDPSTYIDVIAWHRRFACVAPMYHPEVRAFYCWVSPEGVAGAAVPNIDDLPYLPARWVSYLTEPVAAISAARGSVSAQSIRETEATIDSWSEGDRCACVDRAAERALEAAAGRGDTHNAHRDLLGATKALVALGLNGECTGAGVALREALSAYEATPGKSNHTHDFWRMVAGALLQYEIEPPSAWTCWGPEMDEDELAEYEEPGRIWALLGEQMDDAERAGSMEGWDPRRGAPAAPAAAAEKPEDDAEEEEPASTQLGDEFWESRAVLREIRDAARARMAGPDAVLGVTLVRMLACVGPWVRLPAVVGGDGSLNMFVGLVGPSGAGKGAATAAAREALGLPSEPRMLAVGSGEGLAASFVKTPKPPKGEDPKQVQHAISTIFEAAEVDTLAELMKRSGATLSGELRKVYSGENLGQANAHSETRRSVEAHAYRAGLIVGIQPGRGSSLLDDPDGGTPQRFLWLSVSDEHASASEWSGLGRPPRSWSLSPVSLMTETETDAEGRCAEAVTTPVFRLGLTEAIISELLASREAVMRDGAAVAKGARPTVDPLDGHRSQTRLKVAAALALLEERLEVTEEDWSLAAMVLEVSDRVRGWVQRELRGKAIDAEKRETARHTRRALMTAEAEERRTVGRMHKRAVRWLDSHLALGEHAKAGTFRSACTKSTDRHLWEEVLERLQSDGVIELEPQPAGGFRVVRRT